MASIPVSVPVTVSTTVTPKPGWLTSELYLKLLALLLTFGYANGLIPTTGVVAQVAGIAATVLTALGYAVLRTQLKKAATAAITNKSPVEASSPSAPSSFALVTPPKNGFVAWPLMAAIAAFLTMAAAVVLLAGGCGARSKTAETAFINCEEQAIKDKVPQLLPTVVSILQSGVSDWKGQLEALGQYAGEATLACTVKAAGTLFASHKVGGPIQSHGDAELRASAITSDHHWAFKPAPTP